MIGFSWVLGNNQGIYKLFPGEIYVYDFEICSESVMQLESEDHN